LAIIIAVVVVLVIKVGVPMLPKGTTGSAPFTGAAVTPGGKDVMDIGVVTFGGYAGGQLFNEGFGWSKNSRFYKQYKLKVNFIVNDNYEASIEAWKAGEIDVHWMTFDCFSTRAAGLAQFDPVFVFQSDWSRGADVCVATQDITNFNDLRGQKIAVASNTPSHSGLLNMLKAAGLRYSDVIIVEAPDAVEAAAYFKSGRVKAAMVWSPDDADCLSNVPGSHALWRSSDAPYVIADGFFCKRQYLADHFDEVCNLVNGWMTGAAEINNDPTAKQRAVQILAAGLNMPEDWCMTAIKGVRLCTYGDNVNTFNLRGGYQGVTADELYTRTAALYEEAGVLRGRYPSWREISDVSVLRKVNLTGPEHAAEPPVRFTKAGPEALSAPAVATVRLSVNFSTGSASLTPAEKAKIDNAYRDVARRFATMRIRILGNTDNVGGYDMNRELSWRRANAVAEYMASQGFDRNRFVVDGKGPDNPIADNGTEHGRAQNRRTDIELIEQ